MTRAFARVAAAVLLLSCACESRTIKAYPERLAGVGVVLQKKDDGIVISRVVPGGPADGAGLQEGDVLVAVDGEPIAGKSLAAVVETLRGAEGSDVLVGVRGRNGAAAVALKRRALARAGDGYEAR